MNRDSKKLSWRLELQLWARAEEKKFIVPNFTDVGGYINYWKRFASLHYSIALTVLF